MIKKQWNQENMPPGFYRAIIIERTPGFFVFAAYSIGGPYCKEGVFKTLSEAEAIAEAFIAGKKPSALYWVAY